MRHQGPGYHNLCVLSCLAPVVNINIKDRNQHKIAGDKGSTYTTALVH